MSRSVFDRFGPWVAPAIIAGLALLLIGLVYVSAGVPLPKIHDEFSYLLGADTFAQLRLSNPTHPMWVHFETMHVVQEPSYASKYPPGQALSLALGVLVGGAPVLGVWLIAVLMCLGIWWMLRAWVPANWALWGGVLAALQFLVRGRPFDSGSLGYWTQSYWGGALAALGGALVFGALRRLLRKPRALDGWMLGLGGSILVQTRPFQAVLLAFVILCSLALMHVSDRRAGRPSWVTKFNAAGWAPWVIPFLAVLGLTAGWLGYYNVKVTGSPTQLPYQVHDETYAVAPAFLWQSTRNEAPEYRHAVMGEFYGEWAERKHREQQNLSGLWSATRRKFGRFWTFYFGSGLGLLLLILPWTLRQRWNRFALWVCLISLAGGLTLTWFYPHYVAPLAGLTIFLLVQCMRQWRYRLRSQPWARSWLAALPILALVVSLAYQFPQHRQERESGWEANRQKVIEQVCDQGPRHLIFVRYGPQHSFHREWVANGADIEGARVVWARSISMPKDRQLVAELEDRSVWTLLVNADDKPVRLLQGLVPARALRSEKGPKNRPSGPDTPKK